MGTTRATESPRGYWGKEWVVRRFLRGTISLLLLAPLCVGVVTCGGHDESTSGGSGGVAANAGQPEGGGNDGGSGGKSEGGASGERGESGRADAGESGHGGAGSNRAPVADAGLDQTSNLVVGDVVVLDGSGSNDADGDALTFAWSLERAPDTSSTSLSDPASEQPTFTADLAGTYRVRLVVNDGTTDSQPDEVVLVAVIPAPTVTITTPTEDGIFTANPVTLEGTVDDAEAILRVNGISILNDDGAFSANLLLEEGPNTLTVVATNETGDGVASVDVVLNTKPGPTITVVSHREGFFVGEVWDGQGNPPRDAISTVVTGFAVTSNGPPTVTVNGAAAAVTPVGVSTSYDFSAPVELSKGAQTLTVVGVDTLGGRTTVTLSGIADYCHKGDKDLGVQAEVGNGQSDRCHEIDGCSNGTDPASDAPRNQPMPGARFALNAPVEFGSGTIPPSEFFVHGQAPARSLGCNIHDTCYQTCVPEGGGARVAAFNACNTQQYDNHLAECRRHYPASCPFTISGPFGTTPIDPIKCAQWQIEKATCFTLAATYLAGVTAGGASAYDQRQDEYCSGAVW